MDHASKKPVSSSGRVAIVDILRGYALLGVAIINYTSFRDWDYTHGSELDLVLGFAATYIFYHKSALLLSILFGYGFAVLMDRLDKTGEDALVFFMKRMFWLFVIAIVNSIFFSGDILKSYAVLGVVFLLFFRSSARTILLWAIILTCLIPLISGYSLFGMSSQALEISQNRHFLFLSHNPIDVVRYNIVDSFVVQVTWPFYAIGVQHIMLCCFLWGAYAYKIRFAENLATNIGKVKRLFWLSIPAFVISTVITLAEQHVPILVKYCNFFLIPFLCATVFFATGIMWLFAAGKLKTIFSYLQCYGRMTLTNYLVQNVIAFFVFSGVGLSIGNSLPYWFYFVFAVIIYVIQVFASWSWLKKYNYGPAEWLWRRLASGKTFMKRKLILETIPIIESKTNC